MASKLGEAKTFFQKKLGMGGGNTAVDLKDCHSRMSAYNILMEGTLAKKGDLVIGKSWKSRYFMMVSPRVLFYFDEKGKADTFRNTPTSMMDIAGKLVTGSVSFPSEVAVAKLGAHEGQSNVFTVKGSPSDKRTWYLAAPNVESMELWIRAIKEGERFTREAVASPTPVVSTPPAVSVAPVTTTVPPSSPSPSVATVTPPQPQPQQPVQQPVQPMSPGATEVPPSVNVTMYPPGHPNGAPPQSPQVQAQGYPPQPQDGTASISMNIGGPGMGGPPGMGMNMSVTASGMPPPSGPQGPNATYPPGYPGAGAQPPQSPPSGYTPGASSPTGQPVTGGDPNINMTMNMNMGAPTSASGPVDPAFAAFNMATGAAMTGMMVAASAANAQQPSPSSPSPGQPTAMPYGGAPSPSSSPLPSTGAPTMTMSVTGTGMMPPMDPNHGSVASSPPTPAPAPVATPVAWQPGQPITPALVMAMYAIEHMSVAHINYLIATFERVQKENRTLMDTCRSRLSILP